MIRPAAIGLVVLTVLGPAALRNGCHDARQSLVSVPYSYYQARDMRHSIALMPQKGFQRAPDSSSVPIQGRERELPREVFEATVRDSTPASALPASVERGQAKFAKTCVPCHGASLAGDGPVAAFFIPPPDLLAETTRNRSDGFIYSYIRHGGAVMPSYGAQVTAAEAWDLIHFLRERQKTSPR